MVEYFVYLSHLPEKTKTKDVLGALGQAGYNVRNTVKVKNGICKVSLMAQEQKRLLQEGMTLFGNPLRVTKDPPQSTHSGRDGESARVGEVTVMLRNLPKSRPTTEVLTAFQNIRNRYQGRDGSCFGQIIFPQGTNVTGFQRELRTIFSGVVVQRIAQDFSAQSPSKPREAGVTAEQEIRTVRLHNIPPDWQLKTLLGAIKTALGKFDCMNYVQRKKNGTAFMILKTKSQYSKLLGLKSFRYTMDFGHKLDTRVYVTKLYDPPPPELIALAKKAGGNMTGHVIASPEKLRGVRSPNRSDAGFDGGLTVVSWPPNKQVVMVNVPEDWRGDNILGALSKKVPCHFKVMNKPLKRINGCVVMFLESEDSAKQLLELGTFIYNAGPVHNRYDCTIGMCPNNPDAILETKHNLPELPNDVTPQSVRQALIEILYNQTDWVQCTALHEHLRTRFGRQVDMKSVFGVVKVKDYLASEVAFQLRTSGTIMFVKLSPQFRQKLAQGTEGGAHRRHSTPTRLKRDTTAKTQPALKKQSTIPDRVKHDLYYLLKSGGPMGLPLQNFTQRFEAAYGYALEFGTYGVKDLKGLLHALPELVRLNEWQKKVTCHPNAIAPNPRSVSAINQLAQTRRPRGRANSHPVASPPPALAPPPRPGHARTPARPQRPTRASQPTIVPSTNPWQHIAPVRAEPGLTHSQSEPASYQRQPSSPWAGIGDHTAHDSPFSSGLAPPLLADMLQSTRKQPSAFSPFVASASESPPGPGGFGVIGRGSRHYPHSAFSSQSTRQQIVGPPPLPALHQSRSDPRAARSPLPPGVKDATNGTRVASSSPASQLFGSSMQPGPFSMHAQSHQASTSRFQWQPAIPATASNDNIQDLIRDFTGVLGEDSPPPNPRAPDSACSGSHGESSLRSDSGSCYSPVPFSPTASTEHIAPPSSEDLFKQHILPLLLRNRQRAWDWKADLRCVLRESVTPAQWRSIRRTKTDKGVKAMFINWMRDTRMGQVDDSGLDGTVTVPDEYMCPISNCVMRDPVCTIGGQCYERKAIEQWFEAGHRTDPMTNTSLSDTSLIPNRFLRKVIENWVKEGMGTQ